MKDAYLPYLKLNSDMKIETTKITNQLAYIINIYNYSST